MKTEASSRAQWLEATVLTVTSIKDKKGEGN